MPLAGLVTCILIITLGIVDLFFVLFKGSGSSVSNFLVNAGVKAPFVTFTFGCVCGHLFLYMTPLGNPIQYNWFVMSQGLCAGFAIGFLTRYLLSKPKL